MAYKTPFGTQGPRDPLQTTNDPSIPWRTGTGKPNIFTGRPSQTRNLLYRPEIDGARFRPLPYHPTTDPAPAVPLGLAQPWRLANNEPSRASASRTAVSPARPGALAGQYERYLATGLKMMESDNPAIMNMGLRLLHSVNGAAGNSVDLPGSLPDSQGFTDFAQSIRSILADRTLEPARKVAALNELSARARGGREETAEMSGPAIDMNAIDAELARRGAA